MRSGERSPPIAMEHRVRELARLRSACRRLGERLSNLKKMEERTKEKRDKTPDEETNRLRRATSERVMCGVMSDDRQRHGRD
jgi:predicted anti-sigma-YlaC factor YlaD